MRGRSNGSLISMGNGPGTPFSIDKLQDRGIFFVPPGEKLIHWSGVIGEA